MPRAVRDTKLDTQTARDALKIRGKPYYRAIDPGIHLGYRKGKKGGKWLVRWYDGDGGYDFDTFATADDHEDANGADVLSYSQAQERARQIARKHTSGGKRSPSEGPYRVRDAIDDYVDHFEAEGKKGGRQMRSAINTHILPNLGSFEVENLTRQQLRKWHRDVANGPRRVRTGKGQRQQFRDVSNDPDEQRKRKSTANRVLTVLKAALNHAYSEGVVESDDAWRAVKPFRDAEAPRVRYLTDDECKRLMNAAPGDLRNLIAGALLTGCRYSELSRMKVGDFDPDIGNGRGGVHIPTSKGGKRRIIHLTAEGTAFFEQLTAGRTKKENIFNRSGGGIWGQAHQTRPLHEACAAARIEPAIGLHILRHTYASRLAMRGVPMPVIAKQLGHADTRMTERHYAHLSEDYVADVVQGAFGEIGVEIGGNIVPLEKKA